MLLKQGAPGKTPLTRRPSLLDEMVRKAEMKFNGNLRQAFRTLDANGDACVDREELLHGLLRWNLTATPHRVDACMAILDRRGTGRVTFRDFCGALSGAEGEPSLAATPMQKKKATYSLARTPDYELMALPRTADKADHQQLQRYAGDMSDRIYIRFKYLRSAFRSFDLDKDGKLSQAELLAAARRFNLPIPHEHVVALFQQCDRNGDGFVDYDEFASALKRKDALGN